MKRFILILILICPVILLAQTTTLSNGQIENIYKGIIRLQERDSIQTELISSLTKEANQCDSAYKTEQQISAALREVNKITSVLYQASIDANLDMQTQCKKDKRISFLKGIPLGGLAVVVAILLL